MSTQHFGRIAFAGTPEFAATILRGLLQAGHRPVAVFTQPDRRAGRGRKLAAGPVKTVALAADIEVRQPATLKTSEAQSLVSELKLDTLIVAAYGLILPPAVLTAPRHGCLNVHASLLPRWRGAAPVQAAILAGDTHTGVTIMQMDAGLDTGPILLKRELAIAPLESAATLTDKLATLGTEALLATLAQAPASLAAEPQDEALATYAGRIQKSAAELDFKLPAISLERAVRAYDPWPVAYTELDGERLRIWRAEAHHDVPPTASPGRIVKLGAQGIDVSTGAGVLRITELQRAGGKRLHADAFLRAGLLAEGQRLGA